MENRGQIEIRITGRKDNQELTPENYDIREIIAMLENVEGLLYSSDSKERPTISYKIEGGSVRHVLTTSMQEVIGFNAIIGQINENQSIDFLEDKTAKAFENIQKMATRYDYTFYILTSLDRTNEVKLDKTTNFHQSEPVWVDGEFYFYGTVTNAGGKDKANIHLATEEHGIIIIETPQEFLKEYEGNILYKTFGVYVKGKQHYKSFEIDKSSLKFVALRDYNPTWDEEAFNKIVRQETKVWAEIEDKDAWLRDVRGSYEI